VKALSDCCGQLQLEKRLQLKASATAQILGTIIAIFERVSGERKFCCRVGCLYHILHSSLGCDASFLALAVYQRQRV